MSPLGLPASSWTMTAKTASGIESALRVGSVATEAQGRLDPTHPAAAAVASGLNGRRQGWSAGGL